MNNMRTAFVVFACLSVAAGCSETHGSEMDAAITFDAAFPDGGPDAGPSIDNIGQACRGDDDCDGAEAYCDSEFPGGYCTQVCADDLPCPTGSTCIETMAGATCYADCNLDATDGDFCSRDGYGCVDSTPICLPGCDTDAECEDGLVCDTTGGFNGEGQCSDPSATLGDACEGSEQCPPETFCLAERFSGIAGGACGSFGCDPDNGMGCPDNGTCLAAGRRGGGVCLLACADDTECTREDQGCTDSPNGGYCGANFVDENLGQICSAGRGDCSGGVCLSESDTGFPDSYCIAIGCDPVANTGCPGDGVCVDGADGMGFCLDGCSAAGDCRDGYECRNADAEDGASATACMPACTDASVCGNDGFECNTGTGRCTAAFVDASLGEPCSGAEDCVGGRCLSEPEAGWPSGTCTFPGCRLTGSGREAACPTGSACADDGVGDPELGACVDSCTASTECRPGYECIDTLCQPACGDSDCGMGRTCSATTGLCE